MKAKNVLMTVLFSIGCLGVYAQASSLYHEKYRPQYHFSPSKGWVGDPSGLMYYQGKYHLYWWVRRNPRTWFISRKSQQIT